MNNYKLLIAYDGTKYNGFQRQTLHPEKTIQGKLENVLSVLFKEDIKIIASGRTDAGVHAKGQVCNFQSKASLTCEDILIYLAEYLPQDIAVLNLQLASPRFHSRYNAVKKRYSYTIDTNLFANPFMLKYTYHVPQKLDIIKMQLAAGHLIGTKDFKSFTSLKSKTKTTVRTITRIEVQEEQNIIKIIYESDGFLQHMVRIITGTLIEVGLGLREPDDVAIILDNSERSTAGPTAPPHGLCMEIVYY